jgi:hypothetical protein
LSRFQGTSYIFGDVESVRDTIRQQATIFYWGDNSRHVHASDLDRLGASTVALTSRDSRKVYEYLVDRQLSAVPIITGEREFLGMASKAQIEEAVVAQLLGVKSRQHSPRPAREDSADDLDNED